MFYSEFCHFYSIMIRIQITEYLYQALWYNYVGLGMYREWKKTEFPKEYYIWILEQQDREVDQEIDGKMRWERMEE
jgi:hypothetical protein